MAYLLLKEEMLTRQERIRQKAKAARKSSSVVRANGQLKASKETLEKLTKRYERHELRAKADTVEGMLHLRNGVKPWIRMFQGVRNGRQHPLWRS